MLRRALLIAGLCLGSAAAWAGGADPEDIEFHAAASSFPCRDKTPKEFAEANPDRKVIEGSIRISANFNLPEDQVDRIEYRLRMPESFEISDYLPKTTIGSEVVGQIGVGQHRGARAMTVVSLDAGARAGFQIPTVGEAEAKASLGLRGEGTKEVGSNVQMSLLPPKELITSASTQDAGRTLHFKLRQYNQITLQGDKDFAFLAAVPKTWKGDCFTLECNAYRKGVRGAAASQTLRIGLYLNGDLATRRQVDAMARAYRPAVFTRPREAPGRAGEVAPGGEPGPVDPFRKKYAGKYSLYLRLGVTLHIDLHPDGTWEAKGTSSLTSATSRSRGVWSATDDLLVITLKHEKTILYDRDFSIDMVNSKVALFDEKRRIIRTEDGYELKAE